MCLKSGQVAGLWLLLLLVTSCSTTPVETIEGKQPSSGPLFLVGTNERGATFVARIDVATRSAEKLLVEEGSRSDGNYIYPDVATNDEGRLLVALASDSGPELRILDVNGTVLDRVALGAGPGTQLPTDYVFASETRAFTYATRVIGPDVTEDSLRTYDMAQKELLPEIVPLGHCGAMGMVAPLSDLKVAVYCGVPRELRFVTLSERGGIKEQEIVKLPSITSLEEAADISRNVMAMRTVPEQSSVFLVAQDGEVFQIDIETSSLIARWNLQLPANSYVPLQAADTSRDGQSMLVAVGRLGIDMSPGYADRVHKIRLEDGETLWEHQLPTPGLGTVTPEGEAILVSPDGGAFWRVDGAGSRTGWSSDPTRVREGGVIDLESTGG